jgi:hypothetical protein
MRTNITAIIVAIVIAQFIGAGEAKGFLLLMLFVASITILVGLVVIKYIFDIKSHDFKKAIVFFRVCALAMFVLVCALIELTSREHHKIEKQLKEQVYSAINKIPASSYSNGCPEELKISLSAHKPEFKNKHGGCLISLYKHLGGFSVMGQDFFVQNINGKPQIKYSVWRD